MNRARGQFVVVEGVDSVGKSTQLDAIGSALRSRGKDVVVTREPGGDPVAERLRELLLGEVLDEWTQTLLFVAARNLHVKRVIDPALARGATVLVDRYLASTLVYQGSRLVEGMERIRVLHELSSLPYPDVTIVLDLDHPLMPLDSADSFERDGLQRWQQRRESYLSLAQEMDWVVVSGAGTRAEVTARLLGVLHDRGV
ncbi:MAG: dTMP kinase [Ferrimicrobium sp.]